MLGARPVRRELGRMVEQLGVRMPAIRRFADGDARRLLNAYENANQLERERQLAQAKQVLKSAGIRVETMLLQGEVVSVVCQHAADMGCNLIVMGAYGHSRIRQFIVGSTTTGILKATQASVLLLR